MVVALEGLDGAVGAGAVVTLLTILGGLFTLLMNALLKASSKSDEIGGRLVKDKQDRIEALEQEIRDLKAAHVIEVDAIKIDRDHWFLMYDQCRGGTP